MANLDSRDKRGSAISKLGIITIFPNADGSDADTTPQRMQVAGLYSGISAIEPIEPVDLWIDIVLQGIDALNGADPLVIIGRYKPSMGDFVFTDETAKNRIKFPDDLADALSFKEGINSYMTFVTTNGSEGITIGKTLTLTSGFKANLVTKTGAYTTTADDYTILCDASGGSFTITLIALASHLEGMYHIKKIDSSGNFITVDGNGGETIDGAATAVLTVQDESLTIQAGFEWGIL